MPTIRDMRKNVGERKELVRGVLSPLQRGKRDRTIAAAYKRLKPGSDGRIHTGLSVATTSGRLASSETLVEEGSTNLQNQANKIATLDPLYHTRDVMRADDGMQLVTRDYAGAEMYLCFAYSNDWEWCDRLLRGESVHAIHAVEAFKLDCPWQDVKKKHKNVYTTAKNLGFLSIYSGSARTATVTFNKDYPIHGQRITESEVKAFQQVLYDLHPLHEWWAQVAQELRDNKGIVTNCFGYQRPLRDPDESNRLKDALSFYPQSTVAWRMNQSIVEVHDTLDRAGEIELLHQNHDELDLQCTPDCLTETLRETKRIMEAPFTLNERTVYIPTEAKIGDIGGSWGNLHAVEE